MLAKNEIRLIKLIKIVPVLIVAIVCMIITILLSVEKNISLKKDLEHLEKEYLLINKEKIKNEVEKVYDYISYKKSNSEEELKENLKIRVNDAINISNYIYEKYKNKESKNEIVSRIKDALKNIRFNDNRGYYYIYDTNGVNIFHPITPELENKSVIDFENDSKNNVLKDLETKKEAFDTVYWGKPDDLDNQYKKITYNKIFEPYNFIIGTGEYLSDFEKITQNKILSYLRTIKYDKNRYIFVVDKKGFYLSHFEKSYMGINRLNLKDENGFMITKEILALAKDGKDGYLKYVGTIKPQTKLPSEKITYVKGFKDWNWAIATGFYTDELEKQILEKQNQEREKYINNLKKLFISSIILTMIFLFISFYISRKLEKKFYRYKEQILINIKKNREKDNILAQQSKMATMGEMLENIAHQWRQPLSVISTVSTGLKLQYEYSDINKENVIKSMDTITETTRYLSQTIEDFRDYFNPQKEARYFSLKTILEKVCVLAEPQLYSINIQIIKNIKNIEDIQIFGHENEFLQVIINIINIINNSKDEFEKKDLKIKYVFIDAKILNNNEIGINIRDNAGGIENDVIDKIFEPYFTTKFKQGIGIGLYMSKQIIQKHMKGSISVFNEEFFYKEESYKGATFFITLPFKRTDETRV